MLQSIPGSRIPLVNPDEDEDSLITIDFNFEALQWGGHPNK
jgi:hypothetical protein